MLSTLHSAKGLEFDEVFLPDLNEGVLPSVKAAGAASIEEERRLLYVGMTRARERLTMTCVRERFEKAQEPSRFLSPLRNCPLVSAAAYSSSSSTTRSSNS